MCTLLTTQGFLDTNIGTLLAFFPLLGEYGGFFLKVTSDFCGSAHKNCIQYHLVVYESTVITRNFLQNASWFVDTGLIQLLVRICCNFLMNKALWPCTGLNLRLL